MDWCESFDSAECIHWSGTTGSIFLEYEYDSPGTPIDLAAGGVWSVETEDIDGDGDEDMLVAAFSSGMILLYENKGAGNPWNRYEIVTDFPGASNVTFFDVNRDGKQDIIACSYYGSRLSWFESDESGFVWTEVCAISSDIIGPSDFDAFEIDEVITGTGIVLCSKAGDALWMIHCPDTGGLQWNQNIIADNLFGASSIDGADLGNDGDIDYLVTGSDCNTVWLFECVNWLGYQKHTFDDDIEDPTDARWGDIDADGNVDAVSCSYRDGTIHVYRNQGDDTWIRHIVCSDLPAVSGLCLADMTLMDDDLLDIGAVSCNSGKVMRYEFVDVDGETWKPYVLGSVPGASNICCAELDGGPGMELLVGAGLGSELRFWNVEQYAENGSLTSSILDTEASPDWDCMLWEDITPGDAMIGFQVRSSDNPGQMGSWSEVIHYPEDLSEHLADGTRYIQYRVVMETSSPNQTPVLDQLSVSWNQTGIEPNPNPGSGDLLTILSSNPVHGLISFILSTRESCSVSLMDLSGRSIRTIHVESGESYEHSIDVTELSPGIYFLIAEAEDFTEAHSLMILR